MLNKKAQFGIIVTIVVILIVVGLGYYFYSNSSGSNDDGRVVVVITDAAANMGSVSEVTITVDKIEAHSATEGWVTLTSNQEDYNLLELKTNNELELAADKNVAAGTYDQIRLEISKVIVVDGEGSHEAKLPSNELKVNTELEIKENSTSTATFDFIADESLHITGNGKYILAPVIQVETRSDATVEIQEENHVEINAGTVKQNIKVGTDIDGNIGVGVGLASNSNVNVGNDGKLVVVDGNGNGNGIVASDTDAKISSDSDVDVSVGY